MSDYKSIMNKYYSLLSASKGERYNYIPDYEFLIIELAELATIEQLKKLVLIKASSTIDKVLVQQIDSAWSNYINTGNASKIQELNDRFSFSARMGRGRYDTKDFYETLLGYIYKKDKYGLAKGYIINNDSSNLPELINAVFPDQAFGTLYG